MNDTASAKKTEELCSLFSKTVSSLASDAAALRQIKCLAAAVVVCDGVDNEEKENGRQQPNNDNTTTTLRGQLQQVDALVTELESKVCLLHEIVAEEKQALRDMESVKVAAEAQHELLKEMLQATDSAIELQDEERARLATAPVGDDVASATPLRVRRDHAASMSTLDYNDGILRSGAKRVVGRRQYHHRDSIDPRDKPQTHHQRHVGPSTLTTTTPSIHLTRVTQEEWNNVSRTVKGRITLAVVNDAIRDIERVFQKKYAVLAHKSSSSSYHCNTTKGTLSLPPFDQLELQQKLINSHRELQVDEHGDCPWVSEQDLRQCCAFFRNGESTARAILLIIRTVRRLKQVPAKHSQVTYVCLSSSSEDD